jgi:hypothetical protein
MNLLKSFSTTSNTAPGKGFIYKRFFPLPFQNYVILNTQNEDQNFNYVFWNRVIQLVEPYLKQAGLEIVHFIDDKKYHFNHTYIDKSITSSEKAYLLTHSKLYCGSSKLHSLICSEYDIPQVFLKCDYSIDNVLVSQNDIIDSNVVCNNFLNPIGNFINNIRPEEIAKKILTKLFKNQEFEFDKSLSIGKVYAVSSIDLIPDCSFKINNDSKNEIVVRMDKLFSEENLSDQLNNGPASIVTNKPMRKDILVNHKNNIKKIYFNVEKNSDPSFISVLQDLRFDYELITSLNEKELEPEKIKYLNFKKINRLNLMNLSFLDGLDKSKVYFKTNKITIRSGKTFASKWHLKNNIPSSDIRNESFSLPPLLDDSFREESDSFYFLTTEKI